VNVYVESNFVLELTLLQEQHAACEAILRFCETGEARLVVPAFCLVEPLQTLARSHDERLQSKKSLEKTLGQLARSAVYAHRVGDFEDLTSLLAGSTDEEVKRLEAVQTKLLETADVIPLERAILGGASRSRAKLGLPPQDAVVYSSIVAHLESMAPRRSCFLTRDRDFSDPDLVDDLKRYDCKLLLSFEDGYQYISHPR